MIKTLLTIALALFSSMAQAQHIGFGNIVPIGTNTVMGNSTANTASMAALSVGGCSSASSALIWTTNTGFGCNTSINATTLGGATFAAPGAIGSGTPNAISGTTAAFSSGPLTVGDGADNTYKRINLTGASSGTNAGIRNWAMTNGYSVFGTYEIWQSTAQGGDAVTAGTSILSLSSTGLAVIGTISVSALPSASETDIVCYNTGTGAMSYAASVVGCVPSARSMKDQRGILSPWRALAGIKTLTPVIYTYKDTARFGSNEQVGLYADEVCKIDRRLCETDKNGAAKNYDKVGMLTYLVAAIQEQQSQIKRLEHRISTLDHQGAQGQNVHQVSPH